MRKRNSLAVIVVVCGASSACNQIFGTHDVGQVDAAFFDGLVDAPFTCPNAMPPTFSHQYQQVIAQDCVQVTVSTTTRQALAICGATSSAFTMGFGDLSGPLTLAPELTSTKGILTDPRMAADGDRVSFVEHDATLRNIIVFRRAGTTWLREPNIVSGLPGSAMASEISHGPHARILVARTLGDVRELEEQGDGTWLEVGTLRTTYATVSYGIHLSGDALRTWYTSTVPRLAVRPDRDVAFTDIGPIGGAEALGSVFLTDDCGQLYFSTLSSVWVVHQE